MFAIGLVISLDAIVMLVLRFASQRQGLRDARRRHERDTIHGSIDAVAAYAVLRSGAR
jgi:hypothetical protein